MEYSSYVTSRKSVLQQGVSVIGFIARSRRFRRRVELVPRAPAVSRFTLLALFLSLTTTAETTTRRETVDLERCFVPEHGKHAVDLRRGVRCPLPHLSNPLDDMVTFRAPSPP